MAFLDSLDLEFSDKKSHRVRSWFLYEQYKSLEDSQLYAAKRLRNRSYQNKMLNLELSERRTRRTPYKNVGSFGNIRQTKNASIIDTRTPITQSTENFYQTFSEIHEPVDFNDIDSEFEQTDEKVINDWRTVDSTAQNEENNHVDKEKETADKETDVNVLDNVQDDITNNINNALDELLNVKQEDKNDSKVDEEYYFSESTSISSFDKVLHKNKHIIFVVWSKFVSFAYQVIELNHVGFCSGDCSSQLFTAVLACDFIFRGTGKICNILQPYTSPVKYASSDRGDYQVTEKESKINNYEVQNDKESNMWKSKCICSNMMATLDRTSENISVAKSNKIGQIDDENSLDVYKELCSDCMYVSIRNPILKLIKEMDSQLNLSQELGKHI